MKSNNKILFLIFMLVIPIFALSVYAAPNEPRGYKTHFDLAIDETRKQLYGSCPYTGEIQVISTDNLQLTQTISLGASSSGIDISPESDELAVALGSQNQIALINLNTLTVTNYLDSPGVYDVVYGRPGRLYAVGNEYPYHLRVFDTNSYIEVGQSSESVGYYSRLAITSDFNTLFVGKSEGNRAIYRYDISSDTPLLTAETAETPYLKTIAINPDGSKVFTSRGQVWAGDLSGLLGPFTDSGDEIEYVPALERVYITDEYLLAEIDAVNYTVLSKKSIGTNESVARANSTATTLYVSTFECNIQPVPINPNLRNYLPVVNNNYCSDFYDDFSNPSSGWPIVSQPSVQIGYVNNGYEILSNKADTRFLVPAPSCRRPEYVVEVDAKWSGISGEGYGLILGISEDGDEYYLLEIHAETQTFQIWHIFQNGYGYTDRQHSSAINAGFDSNHIRGIRGYDSGHNRIIFEINGVQVADYYAPDLGKVTGAGLFSRSKENSPISEARFDNFSFYYLPNDLSLLQYAEVSGESTGKQQDWNYIVDLPNSNNVANYWIFQ